MDPLPIEHNARKNEIDRRANELLNTFINGNHSDVQDTLKGMDRMEAFGVMAVMITEAGPDLQDSLVTYFRTIA